MTATKLRVNQQAIGDYSELLAEGSDQLQNMFRESLSEDLQPIEPLHYIVKRKLHYENTKDLPATNFLQSFLSQRSTPKKSQS